MTDDTSPTTANSAMKADSPTIIDDSNPDNWWKQAVIYQIYPRSFADENGDGLGDLAGITKHMDYLEKLGVDALWLSPFYPSQLADGGYDVDDYRTVDPRLGTMDDFDSMVEAAHSRGLKIMVDIVPNHSSNHHPWFQAALAAGPGSPERDRYIFRDGRGENGELPPAKWSSTFGGPAWTRVADGQWYLHLFTKEQPDWNWDNPDVHQDFLKTIRFWCDHGADGFRVDVAHGLAKDLDRPNLDDYSVIPSSLPSDGPTRFMTATKYIRFTASGARSSISTAPAASPWRRLGSIPTDSIFMPPKTSWGRSSTSSSPRWTGPATSSKLPSGKGSPCPKGRNRRRPGS